MNLYKPTIYAKDIFHINYKKLEENKIKLIIFDIDNTIAKTNEKYPTDKVVKLFKELKNNKFNLLILTNAIPHRAIRFKKYLDVDTYYLACKPSKLNYIRIIKKYKYKNEEIAAIGDQMLTDIKGANKVGITSILVDPISNKESLFTKLNRLKEKYLISKKKIIERGKYYE